MAILLRYKKIIVGFFSLIVLFGGVFAPVSFGLSENRAVTEKSVVYGEEPPQPRAAKDVSTDYKGLGCSLWDDNFIAKCSAVAALGVYMLSAMIFQAAGYIFDLILFFSVSDETMNQAFVGDAWGRVLSIANILFILVLVVIAISIILDVGAFKSRELIAKVLFIALVINFSLFVSRTVIDAGNITALGFYDAINAPESKIDMTVYGVKVKAVSGGVASSFNPTNLINPESFNSWRAGFADNDFGAFIALAFIFLVGAAISLYAAYIFFMVAFLFVGRVAWLWILMIMSPLAFISWAVPKLGNYWSKWWSKLLSNAFCITVFMFILYIVLIIIGKDFFKSAFVDSSEQDTNFVFFVVVVVMQFMIVIKLLDLSLSKTKDYCSDNGIGDGILKMAKGAVGLAGIATGGALLGAGAKRLGGSLMRGTAGRLAQDGAKLMEGKGMGTSAAGKLTLKTLRNVGDKKFGMKEGYKTRLDSMKKEHETYAKTLSNKKTIKTDEDVLDKEGKPTGEKKMISAQEQYYKKLEKERPVKSWTKAAAVTTAETVAAAATGGASLLLTRPIVGYVRSKRKAGVTAVEDKKKKVEADAKIREQRAEVAKLEQEKKRIEEIRKSAQKEASSLSKKSTMKDAQGNPLERDKTDAEKTADQAAYDKADKDYQEASVKVDEVKDKIKKMQDEKNPPKK
ncbi:hypothetical protein A3E89_00160 [Candidatus Campbellbacteria bacterium RIFCSPHIGHO2_12_FULL_35_10]|uniref:TrbL/VirB6 plasmid conjugal transfer protein n=1 Tax=Candidatus Campbellbacteria bacterium RIFCSPHIGHO2_12_FULL_35_10 TaxID=1797578 RepID=A0A1F5EQB1_9BACT|nr:MAG: hypothetical protein A3E89_00160 [Candidatus Campbellbacteria bacterium RIFCSPHIGHO2_12_FULL_35_10]OGH65905.1 MAG: hypothetical protein A3B83_05000 [Candidatus Magasanikbacteria bacterium RIFCSPHIGHO2_02_FULL_33_17]